MSTTSYHHRRSQLQTYFDRTAVDAWKQLTSDAPVSRIRATVRAGRNQMRQTLLDWLPEDLSGKRLLDAGCGTGALAIEAARRGARVVAIDLSPTLVDLARTRALDEVGDGSVEFLVGDMLTPSLGQFDHIVAMDSLIHYHTQDIIRVLTELTGRTRASLLFTFAPRTTLLSIMHTVGRLFPRDNRAPAIEPVSERLLQQLIAGKPELRAWQMARSQRIASGFYTSQAVELTPR